MVTYIEQIKKFNPQVDEFKKLNCEDMSCLLALFIGELNDKFPEKIAEFVNAVNECYPED